MAQGSPGEAAKCTSTKEINLYMPCDSEVRTASSPSNGHRHASTEIGNGPRGFRVGDRFYFSHGL
jgi:hypothetical protein